MSRRTSRRRGKVARIRRSVRPQYLVLFVVFAGYLVFQTWTGHRLDTLRRERVEFEERIVSTRSALAEAQREFAQESEQSRIVDRARRELGFIDAEVGGRPRICMPAIEAPADEPVLWRLAAGLDRFGGIREAFAGEEKR